MVFTDSGSIPYDNNNDTEKHFSNVPEHDAVITRAMLVMTSCNLPSDLKNLKSRPINFVFDSRVQFSITADRMGPFPVRSDPRWWPAAILKISNDSISATGRMTYNQLCA